MRRFPLALIILLLISLLLGFQVASAQEGYTHPTGAFSMAEFGTLVEEVDDGALFEDDGSMVMVLFGQAPIEVTAETVPNITWPMLNSVNEFDSYELASDQVESFGDGFVVHFTHEPVGDYGEGDAFVLQDGEMLYIVMLLTSDYEATFESWSELLDSFTLGGYEAPVEEEPATDEESGAEPAVEPAPELDGVISSGFDPTTDGFRFFNYGNDIPASNLTPAEMQRMFGDSVCANLVGGECTLAPASQQWMEQINSYMDGGHCEGMAVLSSLMYYGQASPDDFGGSTTNELSIEDNDPLQREIAYWWTTQSTYPGASMRVNESPRAVVNALIDNFQEGQNASEWWAMGFYQRDGSAGHAVTPIGVEDLGNGLYNIQLYDNNFPNEVRTMEVDTNNETWQYEGSPNPEIESFLYDGDASLGNLELVAISPRLDVQNCDFCGGVGGPVAQATTGTMKGSTTNQATAGNAIWQDMLARWAVLVRGEAAEFYQVWLVGEAALLVVDDWGRQIGYSNGQIINDMPGASVQTMRIFQTAEGLDKEKSPVLRIPVGLSFDVNVDASELTDISSSDVSMIGPGYYMDVSDVWLEPGEVDTITVSVDKNRHHLTYWSTYTESPVIELGLETEEADYAMSVQATELTGSEDTFDVVLDMETDEFILNTSYNTEPSTYELYVLRIDDEGEYVYGASDVVMEPENTAYIQFTNWQGAGSPLPVEFDYENDGEVDETFELPDVSGQVDFYEEEQ